MKLLFTNWEKFSEFVFWCQGSKWSQPVRSINYLICNISRSRSSRSQMFFKICVLKNFTNFTEKRLCRSLFNKVARPAKKNPSNVDVFLLNFQEILRTSFFVEHLRDVRYFARSKFLTSSVHKKDFGLIWQVGFKLKHLFYQGSYDISFMFEWTQGKVKSGNYSQ